MDIFISYSTRDRPRAAELASILEEQGYSVWWDRELYAGQEFREKIRSALQECKATVVIWTESSIKSRWVLDESDAAASSHKLIPVRADELDQREVPLGFGALHTIPLSDRTGLLNALKSHFASPPKPLTLLEKAKLRLLRRLRLGAAWFTWRRTAVAAVVAVVAGYVGLSYLDWVTIRTSMDARDFQRHLDHYPLSIFSSQARSRMAGASDWPLVKASRSIEKLNEYTEKFPHAIHSDFARLLLSRLQAVQSGKYRPVLAESTTRVLTADDLNPLSCHQLWTARNEIFYLRGRCFVSDAAMNAFATRSDCPYANCKMIESINASVGEIISPIELKNIDAIKNIEGKKGCWFQDVPSACQRRQ